MTIKFLFGNPLVWYKQLGNKLLQIGEIVPFGHFAIELETFGEPKVYESIFPRFQKLTRSEWNKHYTLVKEYQWSVPEHLQSQVYEWLENQVGKRYAIEQIIFIGLTIVFGWLNLIFNKLVLNGNRAMVCTELGSRFAEKFWGFAPTESHDKIGLKDMEVLSDRYENNVKWQSLTEG
jgi:hypothetical protein